VKIIERRLFTVLLVAAMKTNASTEKSRIGKIADPSSASSGNMLTSDVRAAARLRICRPSPIDCRHSKNTAHRGSTSRADVRDFFVPPLPRAAAAALGLIVADRLVFA
jgi:hypothetical protein